MTNLIIIIYLDANYIQFFDISIENAEFPSNLLSMIIDNQAQLNVMTI